MYEITSVNHIYYCHKLKTIVFHVQEMCASPLAADKSAPLTRSPITPLPSFSPVGAVLPPAELLSPLKGIQASSFYKNSVGRNSVKLSLHTSATPAAKTQGPEEVCQVRKLQR